MKKNIVYICVLAVMVVFFGCLANYVSASVNKTEANREQQALDSLQTVKNYFQEQIQDEEMQSVLTEWVGKGRDYRIVKIGAEGVYDFSKLKEAIPELYSKVEKQLSQYNTNMTSVSTTGITNSIYLFIYKNMDVQVMVCEKIPIPKQCSFVEDSFVR